MKALSYIIGAIFFAGITSTMLYVLTCELCYIAELSIWWKELVGWSSLVFLIMFVLIVVLLVKKKSGTVLALIPIFLSIGAFAIHGSTKYRFDYKGGIFLSEKNLYNRYGAKFCKLNESCAQTKTGEIAVLEIKSSEYYNGVKHYKVNILIYSKMGRLSHIIRESYVESRVRLDNFDYYVTMQLPTGETYELEDNYYDREDYCNDVLNNLLHYCNY